MNGIGSLADLRALYLLIGRNIAGDGDAGGDATGRPSGPALPERAKPIDQLAVAPSGPASLMTGDEPVAADRLAVGRPVEFGLLGLRAPTAIAAATERFELPAGTAPRETAPQGPHAENLPRAGRLSGDATWTAPPRPPIGEATSGREAPLAAPALRPPAEGARADPTPARDTSPDPASRDASLAFEAVGENAPLLSHRIGAGSPEAAFRALGMPDDPPPDVIFGAAGAMRDVEATGILASFALNAAMIPGWPPARALEGPARAEVVRLINLFAPEERDAAKELSQLLKNPALLERLLHRLLPERRRARILAALVVLLKRINAVIDAAMALASEEAGRTDEGRERLVLR